MDVSLTLNQRNSEERKLFLSENNNDYTRKKNRLNKVPAAAVILLILALSCIIGCKASVDVFITIILNTR